MSPPYDAKRRSNNYAEVRPWMAEPGCWIFAVRTAGGGSNRVAPHSYRIAAYEQCDRQHEVASEHDECFGTAPEHPYGSRRTKQDHDGEIYQSHVAAIFIDLL